MNLDPHHQQRRQRLREIKLKKTELGKFRQRLQREKSNTVELRGHLVHGHAVAHVGHLEEASVLHPAWSLSLSTPFRIPKYYLV